MKTPNKKKDQTEPSFKPIPEYGDLMPIEEFRKAVETNCFIDYDGSGQLSDGKRMSTIPVTPSEFTNMKIPPWATHIVWFNR